MKVHWYFRKRVLENPKRSRVTVDACEAVVRDPYCAEVQMIVLEDGETLFNAFEDRNFTREQRRRQ